LLFPATRHALIRLRQRSAAEAVAQIEAYLLHLQGIVGTTNRYGKLITRDYMWDAVARIQYFLEYLERTSSPGAPLSPVGKLLWLEDRGKKIHQRDREIKYIPEHVLFQLEQHMHLLPPRYLPIAVILRASGWRISDVLNLRYDTCLEHTNNGWWLRGEIQTTDILNHKVPISDEIAALVTAQCLQIKETVSGEDNPHRYLFPATTQQRKGRPLDFRRCQHWLNKLAQNQEFEMKQELSFTLRTTLFVTQKLWS
jgi:Phage integrase family